MKIDLLVAEIGSTTTVVNAFDLEKARFLGQGQAPTSVLEGDVRIGLRQAAESLAAALGTARVDYGEMFATSSAAGGLRMTVHGLIYDMTVKAAREAALGAGGIIKMTTAGRLRRSDIESIRVHSPNLILIAGGTDYGERDTAVYNAELIAAARLKAPVIYAGNVENQREMQLIFGQSGQRVYVTENVYPKLDELNIEPTRRIIHRVFEEHITSAPGMEHVRDMVSGSIIPTPGAVMECAMLLYREMGDAVVLDVGGATTDVHSVTEGSEEIASILIAPEPFAKRTVEGDLGCFVNVRNVIDMAGREKLERELSLDVDAVLQGYRAIPQTPDEFRLITRVAGIAAETALTRHSGRLRYMYTPQGRKTYAEGKDLTRVKTLVATGGALTRLPERQRLMESLRDLNRSGNMLFPKPGRADIRYDEHYIMASLGVMSKKYPREAAALLRASLGL